MTDQEASSAPKPLGRVGSYSIAVSAGDNPVPERPVTGEALTRYYLEVLASIVRLTERQDEARDQNDFKLKYRLKIAIKSTEAVAALLHNILDASAPFVCDQGCPHARRALEPAGCKAFVDSLDASSAELRERQARLDPQEPMWVDREIEIEVRQNWRARFGALLSPGSRR
jgi:hypothetical protein